MIGRGPTKSIPGTGRHSLDSSRQGKLRDEHGFNKAVVIVSPENTLHGSDKTVTLLKDLCDS
jgi:hypothetical protein